MGARRLGRVREHPVKRRTQTPHDRALAARVAAASPRSTPTPGYVLEAIGQLEGDPAELLAEWDERASVRQYLGELSREDAERGALGEVIAAHTVQGLRP